MKKELILIGFITIIALTALASARLTISEPLGVYNLGDKLYITVDTVPAAVTGNFEINIVCSNQTVNVYRVPAEPSFSLGVEQKITTYVTLSPSTYDSLIGSCKIVSDLGGEEAVSKSFLISNNIIVTSSLDKLMYDPGEQITLTVNAVKANGNLLNGFSDISDAATMSKMIQDGKLVSAFAMARTAEPGNYTLNINAYDTDGNQTLNSGNSSVSFFINQIPSSIQVSLSGTEIAPEQNFSYSADLFDQSGQHMNGSLQVSLISPLNTQTPLNLNSGETNSISFPANATAGEWNMLFAYNSITEEKQFTVLAVPKLNMSFIDNILVISNLGNAPYNKTLNVTIGNTTEQLALNILQGEERRFSLKAPNGEYNVSVGDGNVQQSQQLLLTGNAVSVNEFAGGLFSKYPLLWYFLLGLVGVGLLVFLFGKVKIGSKIANITRRRDSRPEPTLKPIRSAPMSSSGFSPSSDEKFINVNRSNVSEGESSLVSKGQKLNSSVIVVKISNYRMLKDLAKQEVDKAIALAKERRAVVEFKDGYITMVFSPLITKTLENEPAAARLGTDLLNQLRTFNQKYTDKIDFNIGINNGDLISSIEGGRLKYTAMGNTLLLARKLADFGREKVLVSDSFRTKMIRDIRGERVGQIGSVGVFSIISLTDREANKDKLADLLKRMDHK